MKNKANKYLGLMVVLVLSMSCTELEEPQIDGKRVEIFVPRDSLRTDIATQLFYWYHVEGAEKYELQVVTPSFDKINRLVLDTNVSGNKFEFTLQPGTYEWSVRAYNFSSSTDYTVHTLFIDSTLDLSNQQVVLTAPPNNDTSNQSKWIFRWQNLYNADDYEFQLWQPNLNGQLVQSRTTSKDSLHLTLNNEEGNFLWRVKASNAQSQTTYASRQFYIDTTRPQAPTLVNPTQGQFLNATPINFQWDRGNNSGSSVRDSFYLATDSSFSNITETRVSNSTQLSLQSLSNGIYYWRVRSIDKAGNKGSFSETRQFTLQ